MRTAEAELRGWNFPLALELYFYFYFFFLSLSLAELALEFEVQNNFLEVAEEALDVTRKSARFREMLSLPLWA